MSKQVPNSIKPVESTSSQNEFPVFAMIATILAHFEQHVLSFTLAPLLVLVKTELSLTLSQIGVVAASPLVTLVIFQLLSGYLADRYGSRVLLVGGTGLSAIAMYLVSTSTGYHSLIFYQLFLGIGLSTYHPSGIRLITKMVSEEHKGKTLSFQGAGGIAGTAIIPVFAVFLAQTFNDWRQAIKIIAGIAMIATLVEFLFLISFSEKKLPHIRDSPDDTAPSHGVRDLHALFLSMGFGMILIYSLGREIVFRNVSYFVPLFYESIGYTVYEAGFVSSLLLGIGAIAQLSGGFFADTISKSQLRIFLAASNALASIFLFFLAHAVRGNWLLFVTILVGFTYFVSEPFFMLIISNYAPEDAQGIAFALSFSFMTLFSAFSSVIFGIIGENFGLRQSMDFVAGAAALTAVLAFLLPFVSHRKVPLSES